MIKRKGIFTLVLFKAQHGQEIPKQLKVASLPTDRLGGNLGCITLLQSSVKQESLHIDMIQDQALIVKLKRLGRIVTPIGMK